MKVLLIASIAASTLVQFPAQAASESNDKLGADRGVYELDGPGLSTYSDDNGVRYEYQGEWTKGQYLDPDGDVYEGQWNGKVTRSHDAPAVRPMHAPHHAMPVPGAPYDIPPHASAPFPPQLGWGGHHGYGAYEKCLKDDGVAGAAIGAILGAVAGNRIVGRGNRTEGSLIGAGLGALAGLGVEKSMQKCEKHLPSDSGYGPGYAYGYGAYPYGYYFPAPVIAYSMVPVTTTTVTEETYYETVPVKRKAVRKWKPKAKAKPRCVCR